MRSLLNLIALPSVLLWAAAGCASYSDSQDELAADSIDETALDGQLAMAKDSYYFEIASDVRKCASPLCGGWFLGQLNSSATRCHDGRLAAECYTPVLDWSRANLSEAKQAEMLDACYEHAAVPGAYVIVRGKFARMNHTTPRPDLGRFIVTEAWLAEGDATSAGTFVRVEDNGLRCFAAPCPSLTETTLNRALSTDISALDYTPAGMTEDQINVCTQQTFTADGLLVAGDRYTYQVNSTTAIGRTVTNGYYRLLDQ